MRASGEIVTNVSTAGFSARMDGSRFNKQSGKTKDAATPGQRKNQLPAAPTHSHCQIKHRTDKKSMSTNPDQSARHGLATAGAGGDLRRRSSEPSSPDR